MGSLPVRMQLDLRSPQTTNDARSSPEAPRHSWGAGYGGNCHLSQHLKPLKNMQTHQPISSFIAVSQDSPVFGKELKVAGGHEISPKQTGDPFWSYRGKTTCFFFTTSTNSGFNSQNPRQSSHIFKCRSP